VPIKIFTTGGTLDKVYFDARSDYEVGDPQIQGILEAVGVTVKTDVEPLMRKDSLELTDADRALIARRVRDDDAPRVLITHGTDTMTETARALGDTGGKTVVFVGSLSPARFKGTDAEFNVGFALAAVQLLPPGAYVAMNGRVFPAAEVKKNREANRFEGESYQSISAP
jgi:L-asparaginase